MKKINDLYNNRFDYDEESQKMIESLQLEEKALQAISDMKGTAGWKILGDKFRHELIARWLNERPPKMTQEFFEILQSLSIDKLIKHTSPEIDDAFLIPIQRIRSKMES